MKLTKNNLDALIRETLAECNSVLLEMPETNQIMGDEHRSGDKKGQEGTGAKQKLFHMSQQAQQLHDMLADNADLEEWVQDKLAVAARDLRSIFDHLVYSSTKSRSL
jgi:hypothetical protein